MVTFQFIFLVIEFEGKSGNASAAMHVVCVNRVDKKFPQGLSWVTVINKTTLISLFLTPIEYKKRFLSQECTEIPNMK